MKRFLLSAFLFAFHHLSAQTDLAGAAKALLSARPGDTIVIADGHYKDVEIIFTAKGDSARPIIIKHKHQVVS
jgi:hypothetical protein